MSGSESDGQLDPRGPVLGGAAWGGMWLVTSADQRLVLGLLSLGLLAVWWGWRRSHWLACGVGAVLLACLVAGGLRVWHESTGPLAGLARQGAVAVIEARLVGAGRVTKHPHGGPVWIGSAWVERVDGRGQAWRVGSDVRLTASGASAVAWSALPPGAHVRALVRLSLPAPHESVSAWGRAREPPEVIGPPGSLDTAVETVHQGLRRAVSTLPEDPRALVPALVVGDTSAISDELSARFQVTGLTHLTAVSGANLTLLLGSLLWAVSRLGLRGWWLRGAAALGVAAFVVLCRAEPSVLRAAAMGTVGLAALGWGGRRQGLRYLSWAVIALVFVDPWLSRSLGFTLSVCASAGILLWARSWADILSGWLPRWLAEAMTVPVAAQLATQPLVTAISGQLSVVGLFANLAAGPLVGPGTVCGFLAAGLSVPVPPLAAAFGWLAGWCAQGLCWIALLGGTLPGAVMRWPVTPLGLGVMTATCLILPFVLPGLWRRPGVVVGLVILLLTVVARPVPQPGWPPVEWQAVVCDVGQGDATVFRVAEGQAIVVDTGPEPAGVDRCLESLGVTAIPLLILTHLHADHIGGLSGAMQGRSVGQILTSGITSPASGWQEVETHAGAVPRLVARPGMRVMVGEASVEVIAVRSLAPTGLAVEGESTDENDSSIVMRVQCGGLSTLLAGDVEEAGQSNALAPGPDLSADVLLVPHHGSSRQLAGFLQATGAGVALVSVGQDNGYGHPSGSTLRLLEATGAAIYRTDENGSIGLHRAAAAVVVTVQRVP